MDAISSLFRLTDHDDRADETDARHLQNGTRAAIAALGIGALWGAAAGSVAPGLALANLYKVPMVILLSAASALPAGVLTWRVLRAGRRASSFLVALASGLFGGSLVLGASAPLVALYSHTTATTGPVIAHVSVAAALVVGMVMFARAALRGADARERPRRIAAVSVCGALQLAAALQLNVLAAPILPAPTAFSAGIDGLRGSLHR